MSLSIKPYEAVKGFGAEEARRELRAIQKFFRIEEKTAISMRNESWAEFINEGVNREVKLAILSGLGYISLKKFDNGVVTLAVTENGHIFLAVAEL